MISSGNGRSFGLHDYDASSQASSRGHAQDKFPISSNSVPTSLNSSYVLPPSALEVVGTQVGSNGPALAPLSGPSQLLEQKIFPGVVHGRAQRSSANRSTAEDSSAEKRRSTDT